MTLTVSIPKSCWLTANRHTVNRGHRKAMVDAIHQRVQFEAKRARLAPIRGRVACEWFISYPKGVRLDKGDPTNAQPTTKAFLDALVPRWLEDDGPAHVAWERFRRGPNLDRPGDHEVTLVLVPQVIPFDLEKTA